MSKINYNIALNKIIKIVKPHLSEAQMREVDALLDFMYQNHIDLFAELNDGEIENGMIVTRDGKYLVNAMDKSMHFFLSMYGLGLEEIKEQITELNEEGLSPPVRLVLPRPKVLGMDLEFDDDTKFPQVE